MEQESAAGKTYIGLVLSAFALVFCVPVGILFVSVATGAVGIILGMVGYALGAPARPGFSGLTSSHPFEAFACATAALLLNEVLTVCYPLVARER